MDGCAAALLRPLIDHDLSVVFYDLTTIRAGDMGEQEGDVRRFGVSKQGIIARQFMLGVVQTAGGMHQHQVDFDLNRCRFTAPNALFPDAAEPTRQRASGDDATTERCQRRAEDFRGNQ